MLKDLILNKIKLINAVILKPASEVSLKMQSARRKYFNRNRGKWTNFVNLILNRAVF